ncbi:hypothetical protein Mgra_00000480 [Meloidogyne graminicola]|uniref:Uncharacterized protein n=1 Tax=Meloidogyne graminicola TaxID=189291 RepID=A0A8T0A3U2_9BILA|nr:hypothetical protein Mgra_00000480 [Meloidogyne graminicola]
MKDSEFVHNILFPKVIQNNSNIIMMSNKNIICSCFTQLEQFCVKNENEQIRKQQNEIEEISSLAFHSDIGRMIYTISILLMFSSVILLLMIRSIRRSWSTVEVETLLDAMRFREELDIQQRQKKRLRKAKKKVTAWLCRGNNAKLWKSSPHILLTSNIARTSSIQSSSSFIPEIVISEHSPTSIVDPPDLLKGLERQNSYTPSLSLLYDFSSRKNSQIFSQSNETESGRNSQISAFSCSSSGNGQKTE